MSIRMEKVGMTQIAVDDAVVAVTVLFSSANKVLGFKTQERDGYQAAILGHGNGRAKSWNKPQHFLFLKTDETSFIPKNIYEDRSLALGLSVGDDVPILDYFRIGSYVDVTGMTKGRGFTGVMKRYNFDGLPASHGATKSHRSAGSTGCRTQLGRVPKGKKMAGRYGNEQQTIQNLKIVGAKHIDEGQVSGVVLFVHGAVPGPKGRVCFVKKSIKKGAK